MKYLLAMGIIRLKGEKCVSNPVLSDMRQISVPVAFFPPMKLGRSQPCVMTRLFLQVRLSQTNISMAISRGSIRGKNAWRANVISEWMSIRVAFSTAAEPFVWILSVPGVANLAFYVDGRRPATVDSAAKRTGGCINLHVLQQLRKRQWHTCIQQTLYFQTV